MDLTQRVFASVMESVQINVILLGDFEFYTAYLHSFFSILFKLLIFQLFPDKICKIVFRVTKLESETKIQEIPTENG